VSVSPEAAKYFQLLIDHKIPEAEKELESLRGSGRATEWTKGYLKALEGLHQLAEGTDDRYLYLAKERLEGDHLAKVQNEFSAEAQRQHHGDYDRGYFKALADFATYLAGVRSAKGESTGATAARRRPKKRVAPRGGGWQRKVPRRRRSSLVAPQRV